MQRFFGLSLGLVSVFFSGHLCRAESYTYQNLGNWGVPTAINSAGVIVGTTVGGEQTSSILYDNGQLSYINIPGSINVVASAINNLNQVAGYVDRPGLGAAGFIYENGTGSLISVPGATSTHIQGLNNLGAFVGQFTGTSAELQGFMLSQGALQILAFPGASTTHPMAINDTGEIVGSYAFADGHQNGFIYRDGAYVSVSAPGSTDTFVYGVNSNGEMAGTFIDSDGTHGFTEYNGVFAIIDAPASSPNYGTIVRGLNDEGSIVGSSPESFLGTAADNSIPEPRVGGVTTLGLLIVGASMITRHRSSLQ